MKQEDEITPRQKERIFAYVWWVAFSRTSLSTLVAMWEPGKGINVTELGGGSFLFQFFHEVDVAAVLNQGPWTFNQYIMVGHRITETNQVERVPLHQVDFWVQIHNLHVGFRSSKIVQDIQGRPCGAGGLRRHSKRGPIVYKFFFYL